MCTCVRACSKSAGNIWFFPSLCTSHIKNKKIRSFTQSILESFMVKKTRLTFSIKNAEDKIVHEKKTSSLEKTEI